MEKIIILNPNMLNPKQLKHLLSLVKEEERLIELLSKQSIDQLKNIKQDIVNELDNNQAMTKSKRNDCFTIISYIDTISNGLKEKDNDKSQEENVEMINTSEFEPLTSEDLIKILGITIKKDNENKLITFLCMLSSYTKDSQFNLSFNAPSSSGKSYIPTEVAELFPASDVIEVGYCSPTAFFHDKAKEYKKETNELLVDLSNKIIIFLDQPHTLLLQHLRPILSHDKKEIKLKITDKSQKAGLRTKNILLRGFPSVIFCTAGLTIDEQESTRFILLSPEINQEKIREGVLEKIRKAADSNLYYYSLEMNKDRQLLKKRILAIKQETIDDIVIKNPQLIKDIFFNKIKILKPRHQRDMGRIIALIKVSALLNLWFRVRDGSSLIVNEEDIREAFKLWDAIAESQELNLPPFIFNLYKEIIVTAYEEKNIDEIGLDPQGLSRQEILKIHLQVYGRPLSNWTFNKEIIPMLEFAGLIIQEPDEKDRRRMLIYPTTVSTISSKQNNGGVEGGVNNEKKGDSNYEKE